MIEWGAFRTAAATFLKPLWTLLTDPRVLAALGFIASVGVAYWLGGHVARLDCEAGQKDATIVAQGDRLGKDGIVFGQIEDRLGQFAIDAGVRQAEETARTAQLATFTREIEANAQSDDGCRLTARDAELLNALDSAPAADAGGAASERVPDH